MVKEIRKFTILKYEKENLIIYITPRHWLNSGLVVFSLARQIRGEIGPGESEQQSNDLDLFNAPSDTFL